MAVPMERELSLTWRGKPQARNSCRPPHSAPREAMPLRLALQDILIHQQLRLAMPVRKARL